MVVEPGVDMFSVRFSGGRYRVEPGDRGVEGALATYRTIEQAERTAAALNASLPSRPARKKRLLAVAGGVIGLAILIIAFRALS